MNRKIFLSGLFGCVFLIIISPVELKLSEEYEDVTEIQTSDGLIQANDDIHIVDERWQRSSQEEDIINNGIGSRDNEQMQADEPPQDASESTITESTTSATTSEQSGLTEDIPMTPVTTDPSVNLDGPSEYSRSISTVTETTNSDVENVVDDTDVLKTTNENTDGISQPENGESVPIGNGTQTISVNKLSDQIKLVLQKYKETGNVVVPDVKVPDPMHIPDMEKRVSMVNMKFKNQTVYGLSNFTVQHINTDLEKMQVYVMLHMRQLVILGNYSMSSFLSRASGPFNVTLLDVTTEGAAALHYTDDGKLEASETDMDMSFRDIKLDFKNLGLMGAFFQGVAGAVGSLIFEGIKLPIITEVNTKMKDDVNLKIRAMSSGIKTNSKMSPVDQAILEGRTYVKEQGYDPYTMQNRSLNIAGLLKINITEFTLRGLSRFYRVGEVSLSMDNGTVEFDLHLAADNLTGNCVWSAGFGRSKLRDGISSFTVDHIQGKAVIKQSLNLDTPPLLHDIDFLLGNVALKTNREDALEQVAELIVNNLPLLIRHIIVDGMEQPVKFQAQKLLDQVDVSKIVDNHLPRIDQLGI